MSVVGLIVVMFVVFLCSGFRSPSHPLICFSSVFMIICVSCPCSTDEVENRYADRIYTVDSRYLEFQGTH